MEIGGDPLGSYNDGSMIEPFRVTTHGGVPAGEVTSACHSPRLERNIGLAMVQRGIAQSEGGELAEAAELHAVDAAEAGQAIGPVGEFVARRQGEPGRGAGSLSLGSTA